MAGKNAFRATTKFEDYPPEPRLVLFHMIGCGHCDRLRPEWDAAVPRVLDEFESRGLSVHEWESTQIVPVTSRRFSLEGFPTIMLLHPSGESVQAQPVRHTSDSIVEFVREQFK